MCLYYSLSVICEAGARLPASQPARMSTRHTHRRLPYKVSGDCASASSVILNIALLDYSPTALTEEDSAYLTNTPFPTLELLIVAPSILFKRIGQHSRRRLKHWLTAQCDHSGRACRQNEWNMHVHQKMMQRFRAMHTFSASSPTMSTSTLFLRRIRHCDRFSRRVEIHGKIPQPACRESQKAQ